MRRAEDRGHFDHGWLSTRHTFSFGRYDDPAHRGFRSLRVMNEDSVSPGQGFGTHPHRDMEIVSYVLDGALEHRDSMGHGEVLTPGEFQRMSAGTGITHSEFNPSPTASAHFYQIWIEPAERGVEPSYEQRRFDVEERTNRLRLVASPDGTDGSLTVGQDVKIYLGALTDVDLGYSFASGRFGWLQVLRGQARIGDMTLATGDGVAIADERHLSLSANAAELMLFDLA